MREALEQTGCPVCRLAVRSVGRWLASVAYDQINDIELRNELRAARGFCNVHSHRWAREVRSVLGTAIVYQDLLKASLRDLTSFGDTAQRGPLMRAILGGPDAEDNNRDCPACRVQVEAEARYLTALIATVTADADVLQGTEGVCLRHARAAQRRGGAGADRIVQQTRSAIEHLLDELAEVIRKEDYRFRHEPRTEDERTAPGRAIARAAGAEGLT